jgi:ATP-dependent HslUV protease subunit HslV
MLIVMDSQTMLLLSGAGDVVEPDEGVIAIGSGGNFALSAAKALLAHTQLSAADVAREAMRIAGQICVYTNDSLVLEELP